MADQKSRIHADIEDYKLDNDIDICFNILPVG